MPKQTLAILPSKVLRLMVIFTDKKALAKSLLDEDASDICNYDIDLRISTSVNWKAVYLGKNMQN
jgi:hypothetical protein